MTTGCEGPLTPAAQTFASEQQLHGADDVACVGAGHTKALLLRRSDIDGDVETIPSARFKVLQRSSPSNAFRPAREGQTHGSREVPDAELQGIPENSAIVACSKGVCSGWTFTSDKQTPAGELRRRWRRRVHEEEEPVSLVLAGPGPDACGVPRLIWRANGSVLRGRDFSDVFVLASGARVAIVAAADGRVVYSGAIGGGLGLRGDADDRSRDDRSGDDRSGETKQEKERGGRKGDGVVRKGGVVKVTAVAVDCDRVAVAYENGRDKRMELKLIEAFEQFDAVDRLESLKAFIASSFPPLSRLLRSRLLRSTDDRGTGEEPAGGSAFSLQYFDQSFALPLPDVHAIAFTQTQLAVTPATLVLHSRLAGKFYTVPHRLLSARRQLPDIAFGVAPGKMPEPDQETLMAAHRLNADAGPYDPVLLLQPIAFDTNFTHTTNSTVGSTVGSVHSSSERLSSSVGLLCSPGAHESESVCHSLQREGTMPFYEAQFSVSPASSYDRLPPTFSRTQVAGTIIVLLLSIIFVFRKANKMHRTKLI